MPDPRLIHPIDVTIEIIDKIDTHYNENADEPVRAPKRPNTVTIPAQVKWTEEASPTAEDEGIVEESKGFFTFLIKDLRRYSMTDDKGNPGIKRGSKITRIDKFNYELFTTKTQPMGHYPEHGPTLLRVYFNDRN